MALTRTGLAMVSLAALAIAGCQSSRFASDDTTPEPLPAAPAGDVAKNTLPPPATPPANNAGNFPDAPGNKVASVTPPSATPPASAVDLTPASIGGVWTVSISGQSCKIATSQTKFGSGYRAGPLRCPEPVSSVKSWNVAGKQLSLYDENGSVMARLYSSGSEKFDGQTESGQAISFSR